MSDSTKKTFETKPELAKYFEEKKVLIIVLQSDLRITMRILFKQLGVQSHNIYTESNVMRAIQTIKEQKPCVIISAYNINGFHSIRLLPAHLRIFPNRLKGSFFYFSNENSAIKETLAIENEIDGYFTEPFTLERLKESLENIFLKKAKPDEFSKNYYQGKQHFFHQEYDLAKKQFSKAQQADTGSAKPVFWLGKCYLAQKEYQKAIDFFDKALELQPTHYNTTINLVELHFQKADYEKAYHWLQQLISHHPINPERIPLYIEVSMANEAYSDILLYAESYYLLADGDKVDEVREAIFSTLIEIAPQLYEDGRENEGLEALKVASELSAGEKENLEKIANVYFSLELWDRCEEFFDRYSEAIGLSTTLQLLRAQLYLEKGEAGNALQKITPMINNTKIKDHRVFEVAIRSSILLGRTEKQINDLIHEGSRKFPNFEGYFTMLFEETKEELEEQRQAMKERLEREDPNNDDENFSS